MNIIQKIANVSGAYPVPQNWDSITPPNGYAAIADTVDMADFYTYNGFVTLTIEAIEHTRLVEKVVTVEKTREVEKIRTVEKTKEVTEVIINDEGEEETVTVTEPYCDEEVYYEHETYYEDEVQTVEESYTVDTVTTYAPNVEAWEAWKASLPAPVEPEPTTEERLAALEEQVAQADETAIELYEMQLMQDEINAAQDDALIEIYEMIGG